MTALPNFAEAGPIAPPQVRGRRLRSIGYLARAKPVGFASAIILVVLCGASFLAPWIAPHGPTETNLFARLEGPSTSHFFGTDQLGRDLFSRTLFGGRVSLGISLASAVAITLFALLTSATAGYLGGVADVLLQRFIDALMAAPTLLIVLVVLALFGSSIPMVIFAIVLALCPGPCRIVRAAVLQERDRPYILASVAIGAGSPRIIARHILPNIIPTVIVASTLLLGTAVTIEASVAFLGLGVQPPNPSWGSMLSRDGLLYMLQSPWIALWPGLCLALSVFAVNMLGDAMRDLLDPRLRGVGRAPGRS